MAFRIDFDTEHKIVWKHRHLTDESLLSFYHQVNVVKAFKTRAILGDKISGAVLCAVQCEYSDGTTSPCFMAYVGDTRSPFGGYTYVISDPYDFLVRNSMEGIIAHDKFGKSWTIPPREVKKVVPKIFVALGINNIKIPMKLSKPVEHVTVKLKVQKGIKAIFVNIKT